MIDMSHLTTDIQQILHNLITTYKEALSVNKFDIGKFLGFPTGITLDVREGMSAFQKEHPIKGIDKAAVDETIQGLIRAGVFSKATVYLSIFGLILTRTYIVTTFYTPEHRRARIRCNSPDHHKQFFTPVYISISCHPFVFEIL